MEKDEINELTKHFRTSQEKYVYYLIALSVASVGFSVQKTIDSPLKYSQLLLASAVASWGVSIIYGLAFLRTALDALAGSVEYWRVIYGKHPLVGNDQKQIEKYSEYIKGSVTRSSNKTPRYFRTQTAFFFVGMLFFIIWHILEMYLRTHNLGYLNA